MHTHNRSHGKILDVSLKAVLINQGARRRSTTAASCLKPSSIINTTCTSSMPMAPDWPLWQPRPMMSVLPEAIKSERIVYRRVVNGQNDLYSVKADGSGTVVLAGTPTADDTFKAITRSDVLFTKPWESAWTCILSIWTVPGRYPSRIHRSTTPLADCFNRRCERLLAGCFVLPATSIAALAHARS